MQQINKWIVILCSWSILSIGCNKNDDDNTRPVGTAIRDRAEQQTKDDEKLQTYFKTHTYKRIPNPANPNFMIPVFDTLINPADTKISEDPNFKSITIDRHGVAYQLYYLLFRSGIGVPNKKSQPTFADSTLVTYRGELIYDGVDKDGDGIPDQADIDLFPDKTDLDNDGVADDADADDDGALGTDAGKIDTDGDGIIDSKDPTDNNNPDRRVFDSMPSPFWMDLTLQINGFSEIVQQLKIASGNNNTSDGTLNFKNDFGDVVVFIPSGLGYFSTSQKGVPLYSNLIFSIQLYQLKETDHDRDGIPSYLEDLNGDTLLNSDNSADDTDKNTFSNYLDADDDGDKVPTKDEITVLGDLNGSNSIDNIDQEDKENREIIFYDDDNDGIFNHLDSDDRIFKNN